MSKLKCLLILSLLASPAFAQKLSARLGTPAAKSLFISAEIRHEGSFELQRTVGVGTNWVALTNFNSFPGTNTFSTARTNKQNFYRVVRLNIPPAITAQPVGATNYIGKEIQLEGGASGSWPLRYQWLKNTQPIASATSNKLTLKGGVDLSGNYSLVASNLWGVALSTAVSVKVINPVAADIAGKKIRYAIKGAQGGAISTGSFDTTYSSLGSYGAVSNDAFLNDSGYWQYGVFSGQPVGRILISGSFIYPDGTVTDLTFTNETSGTYLLQTPNQAQRQFGDFTFVP
jgi:hypothetical protein